MWEDDAGSIDINGTLFFLQQAHWHWPAEHTINCRRLISPKVIKNSFSLSQAHCFFIYLFVFY